MGFIFSVFFLWWFRHTSDFFFKICQQELENLRTSIILQITFSSYDLHGNTFFYTLMFQEMNSIDCRVLLILKSSNFVTRTLIFITKTNEILERYWRLITDKIVVEQEWCRNSICFNCLAKHNRGRFYQFSFFDE